MDSLALCVISLVQVLQVCGQNLSPVPPVWFVVDVRGYRCLHGDFCLPTKVPVTPFCTLKYFVVLLFGSGCSAVILQADLVGLFDRRGLP